MANSWFCVMSWEIMRQMRNAPSRHVTPTQSSAAPVQMEMKSSHRESTGTVPTRMTAPPSRHQAAARSDVIFFLAWNQKLAATRTSPMPTMTHLIIAVVPIPGPPYRPSSSARWYTWSAGRMPLPRLTSLPWQNTWVSICRSTQRSRK